MGYDMKICVFKKKTLQKIQSKTPDLSLKDIYSSCLYAFLYPNEFEFPMDEKGEIICDTNINIFNEFFNSSIENDDIVLIDKNTFDDILLWLEKQLKTITLYDFVLEKNLDKERKLSVLMGVYKDLSQANIDFNKDFVIFTHNW